MSLLSKYSLAAAILINAASLRAQDPAETPRLLRINVETIKPGKGPAHAKHEEAWPVAFATAKLPFYYLAMTPLSGATETWYMSAFASYEEMGKVMETFNAAPGLAAQLDRLQEKEADFISGQRVVTAELVPELTIGSAPDRARIRGYKIWTYRVRIANVDDFQRLARIYLAEYEKLGLRLATYLVAEGVNQPTYLMFRPIKSLAELDGFHGEGERARASMTAADRAIADSLWGLSMLSAESNTYLISAGQSHVPAAFATADPEFWGKNPGVLAMRRQAAVQAGAPARTPTRKP
jgi:hypothetical protein